MRSPATLAVALFLLALLALVLLVVALFGVPQKRVALVVQTVEVIVAAAAAAVPFLSADR